MSNVRCSPADLADLKSGAKVLVLCSPRFQLQRVRGTNPAYQWSPAQYGILLPGHLTSAQLHKHAMAKMHQRGVEETLHSPDISSSPLTYTLLRHHSRSSVVPASLSTQTLQDLELHSAAPLKYEALSPPPSSAAWAASSAFEGKCVQELIFAELAGKPLFSHLTPGTISEQFASLGVCANSSDRGVTASELKSWCERFGKGLVGLYACSPATTQIFLRYDPPGGTRYRLAFVLNDAHAHAITSTPVKQSLALTGEVRVLMNSDLRFRIDSDAFGEGFDELDTAGASVQETAWAILECKHRIVLVYESEPPTDGSPPLDNLLHIIGACTLETGFCVTAPKFRADKIIAFLEPSTKKLVMLATDMAEVKEICSALSAVEPRMPESVTRFRNQSVGTLSVCLFNHLVGPLPRSCYNQQVRSVMDHPRYATKPLIDTFEEGVCEGRGLDITKAYSASMLLNETPYPVFDAFSEIVPYTHEPGKPLSGEYIIPEPITLPFFPARLHQIKYSANLVAFLLEIEAISPGDIEARIKPSRLLAPDTFKAFVSKLNEHLTPKQAKRMANILAGTLGKKYDRHDKGFFTNSEETAIAVFMAEAIKRGTMDHVRIQQLQSLFFVRLKTQRRLATDHLPIWNHIVSGGIVQLLRLCARVHGAGLPIVGVKVDAVFFSNDAPHLIEELMDSLISSNLIAASESDLGKYREEEFRPIAFRDVRAHAERQAERYRGEDLFGWRTERERSFESVPVPAPSDPLQSCFFTGGPGHGKSTLLRAIHDHHRTHHGARIKVLSYTTCAVNNLKTAGLTRACTFDSFFYDPQQGAEGGATGGSAAQRARGLTAIFVEEHSQTPKKWLNLLAQAKHDNPGLVLMFFGDENQTPPIEMDQRDSRQYRYSRTRILGELCGFRQCSLPYVEASARYGAGLRAVVELLRTGDCLVLDGSAPAGTQQLPRTDRRLLFGVCKTNATKKRRDALAMRQFVEAHPGEEVLAIPLPEALGEACRWKQAVTLLAGMPVTCRVGNASNAEKLRVDNNDKLVVARVDAEAGRVVLSWRSRPDKAGRRITVAARRFHCHFDLGFCTTVTRAQGCTMREPYNVFDLDRMSSEEVYTAVSRGTRLEDVRE